MGQAAGAGDEGRVERETQAGLAEGRGSLEDEWG